MEQFVLVSYSVYQSKSTLPRKKNLEQKQEKQDIVTKNFDSVYCAVNARLKTSNKKHLIDLILNSARIKLSQSENIILDNSGSKKSLVDFVRAIFPDIYFTILEATQLSPNFVINKNAKQKTEELGSLSKSDLQNFYRKSYI